MTKLFCNSDDRHEEYILYFSICARASYVSLYFFAFNCESVCVCVEVSLQRIFFCFQWNWRLQKYFRCRHCFWPLLWLLKRKRGFCTILPRSVSKGRPVKNKVDYPLDFAALASSCISNVRQMTGYSIFKKNYKLIILLNSLLLFTGIIKVYRYNFSISLTLKWQCKRLILRTVLTRNPLEHICIW